MRPARKLLAKWTACQREKHLLMTELHRDEKGEVLAVWSSRPC